MHGLEGHPSAADLGDDLLGRLGPEERAGVLVVVGNIVLDRLDQFGDAAKTAPPDPFGRDVAEPPLDHVQPGGARRGEVKVEPLVFPALVR